MKNDGATVSISNYRYLMLWHHRLLTNEIWRILFKLFWKLLCIRWKSVFISYNSAFIPLSQFHTFLHLLLNKRFYKVSPNHLSEGIFEKNQHTNYNILGDYLPPPMPIRFPRPPAAPCWSCLIIFCNPPIPPKMIQIFIIVQTWFLLYLYPFSGGQMGPSCVPSAGSIWPFVSGSHFWSCLLLYVYNILEIS